MRILKPILLVALVASSARSQVSWSVDPKPIIDISGNAANDSVNFSGVTGVTRFPNGVIAVADGFAPAVVFFDANGKRLRSAGRSGQGPGEFPAIIWMGRCARDSVFVLDPMQNLTVISSSGGIGRRFRFPEPGKPWPELLQVSCTAAGRIAYLAPTREKRVVTEAGIDLGGDLYHASGFEAAPAKIGEYNSFAEVLRVGGGAGPRPLGRYASVAVSRDFVFVATADSASFDAYDANGAKTTIRPSLQRQPATKEHLHAAINAAINRVPPQVRARVRPTYDGVPLPSHLPWYSRLLADESGTAWLVLSSPGGSPTRLRAYSARGAQLADLALPCDCVVAEVGADYILATYDDANDIPHVVVYRLKRG